MKVKELIKELKKFDEDCEVKINVHNHYYGDCIEDLDIERTYTIDDKYTTYIEC